VTTNPLSLQSCIFWDKSLVIKHYLEFPEKKNNARQILELNLCCQNSNHYN